MKQKNSLILDDEFLQYCKINNIEDVEKLAREVFNKGFTILKYGEKLPPGIKPREEVKEEPKVKKESPAPPVTSPPTLPIKRIITKEVAEELKREIENTKKNNIYGE